MPAARPAEHDPDRPQQFNETARRLVLSPVGERTVEVVYRGAAPVRPELTLVLAWALLAVMTAIMVGFGILTGFFAPRSLRADPVAFGVSWTVIFLLLAAVWVLAFLHLRYALRDVARKHQISGVVIDRCRRRFYAEEPEPPCRLQWFVAVDDGRHDKIVAWLVPRQTFDGLQVGTRVQANVSGDRDYVYEILEPTLPARAPVLGLEEGPEEQAR